MYSFPLIYFNWCASVVRVVYLIASVFSLTIARKKYLFHILFSAEAETKLKLEKVTEIKKINAQMMLIKR